MFTENIAISNGTKDEKCDYLIVNFWNTVNYGASLTAWAMQEFVKSCGCSCMLLYHNDFWNIDLYENSFSKRFAMNFLNVSRDYSNQDLKRLSKNVKGVILGSDQVLRLDYMGHNLYKYLLNWVDKNTKKIAISPSFGINQEEFEKSDKFTPFVKRYMTSALKSFDYLSCREVSGIDIFKNVFGVVADVVVDPVFLIDKSKYNEIISYSNVNNDGKIVSYILDDNEEYNRLNEYLSKKENAECVSINGRDYNVEDWLKSIKNCKLLITDSFHGVCFALIFGKPFVCIRNKNRGNTRFDSLVTMFCIEKNFIYSVDEVIDKEYDFSCNASKLIEEYVKKNIETIKNVFNGDFSNNLNAVSNKVSNYRFLKIILLRVYVKKIVNYFKYLRCKFLCLICSKKRKEHYKKKKKYYKQNINMRWI